jgi:hypothetical protein
MVRPQAAPLSQTMERYVACLREVLRSRAEP